MALAPRPPAVAKPEADTKRKAAPKEVAAKPEGRAKIGAKAKAVGDVGVAPVLPVACGLIGCGPVLPPLEPTGLLPQHFPVPRVMRAASDCGRCSTRFRFASISRRAPPSWFPTCNQREFAPPAKVGVGPPPVAHVSVTTVDQLGGVSRWFHGPAGFEELHGMFDNPGEFVEFLVCDRVGAPSATSIVRLTHRWPSSATGWFAEVHFVGCSDPLFGQLLAQLLCTSVSSLCCTWVSLRESWVPPAVVASAVLHSAQTQGRVAQIGAPQRDVPGPVLPKMCEAAPCAAKAAPNLDVNATPTVSVPADASVVLVDPNLAGLLEKVAGLKERLSARRSLGGLLAEKAAKRAEKAAKMLGIAIENVRTIPVDANAGEEAMPAVTRPRHFYSRNFSTIFSRFGVCSDD